MVIKGSWRYLLGSENEREATSEEAVINEDETIFNPPDWPLTGEAGADAIDRAWDKATYEWRALTRSPTFTSSFPSTNKAKSSGGNVTRYDMKTEY